LGIQRPDPTTIARVIGRSELLAMAEGSNDLERLPAASPAVEDVLARWARSEASEQDLLDAEQRILAASPVDQADVSAPRAPRAA
jgi:hypothetical protein